MDTLIAQIRRRLRDLEYTWPIIDWIPEQVLLTPEDQPYHVVEARPTWRVDSPAVPEPFVWLEESCPYTLEAHSWRLPEPCDASDFVPDDTLLPLDAWNAKVDALLADCAVQQKDLA